MSNRRKSLVMVLDGKVVRKRRLPFEHRAIAQGLQSQGYNRKDARALARTPMFRAMSLESEQGQGA